MATTPITPVPYIRRNYTPYTLFVKPYIDGIILIQKGFTAPLAEGSISKSLINRVVQISKGLLLLIPVINTVIAVAILYFASQTLPSSPKPAEYLETSIGKPISAFQTPLPKTSNRRGSTFSSEGIAVTVEGAMTAVKMLQTPITQREPETLTSEEKAEIERMEKVHGEIEQLAIDGKYEESFDLYKTYYNPLAAFETRDSYPWDFLPPEAVVLHLLVNIHNNPEGILENMSLDFLTECASEYPSVRNLILNRRYPYVAACFKNADYYLSSICEKDDAEFSYNLLMNPIALDIKDDELASIFSCAEPTLREKIRERSLSFKNAECLLKLLFNLARSEDVAPKIHSIFNELLANVLNSADLSYNAPILFIFALLTLPPQYANLAPLAADLGHEYLDAILENAENPTLREDFIDSIKKAATKKGLVTGEITPADFEDSELAEKINREIFIFFVSCAEHFLNASEISFFQQGIFIKDRDDEAKTYLKAYEIFLKAHQAGHPNAKFTAIACKYVIADGIITERAEIEADKAHTIEEINFFHLFTLSPEVLESYLK